MDQKQMNELIDKIWNSKSNLVKCPTERVAAFSLLMKLGDAIIYNEGLCTKQHL